MSEANKKVENGEQGNRLQDMPTTADASEQKKNAHKNKEEMITPEEKSSTTHGGDPAQSQSVDGEYPVVEGKKRHKGGKAYPAPPE